MGAPQKDTLTCSLTRVSASGKLTVRTAYRHTPPQALLTLLPFPISSSPQISALAENTHNTLPSPQYNTLPPPRSSTSHPLPMAEDSPIIVVEEDGLSSSPSPSASLSSTTSLESTESVESRILHPHAERR